MPPTSRQALVLSCPLTRDGEVRLKTEKDYGDVVAFLRGNHGVSVHPASIHTAEIRKDDFLRHLARFVGAEHDLFIVAIQGESQDGKLELCHGTVSEKVSCQEIMQLWRHRHTNWALPPASLFLLLDFCHSGAWAVCCAHLPREWGVFVQASCSEKGKTPDDYIKSFSQTWISTQLKGEIVFDPKNPKSKRNKPVFHVPPGSKMPCLAGKPIHVLGNSCTCASAEVPHNVCKVDGSACLANGSEGLHLHMEVMKLMSSCQFESLKLFEQAAQAIRGKGPRQESMEDILLFHVQKYYLIVYIYILCIL